METADILSLISIISFVLAGAALAVAVFLWFAFKIPSVIGDLSGRTARKSIAKMREENAKSGNKVFRPSAVNASRGKVTGVMTARPAAVRTPAPAQPAKPVAAPSNPAETKKKTVRLPQPDTRPETGLLAENKARTYDAMQTELLDAAAAVPEDGSGETMPLVDPTERVVKRPGGVKLQLLEEVMLIHTDEVI